MGKKYSISLLTFVLSVVLTVPALCAATRTGSQEGQNLPAVAVHSNVPQGSHLAIQNVVATPAPLGSAGIRYEVTNNSTLRLIAMQIEWTLKFAHRTPMRTVVRRDYFFSQTALAPGSSSHFMMGAIEDKTSGAKWDPLQSATATVTYAEFSNGTQYGSDIQSAARWFANYRTNSTAFYRQALAAYKMGGTAALSQALNWRREPGTMGGRAAWVNLHQIQQQKGSAGLVAALSRLATLSPPNQ